MNKNLAESIIEIARNAKSASMSLLSLSSGQKDTALQIIADKIIENKTYIQSENNKDLKAGATKGLSKAMLDRLELSDNVIESIVSGIKEVVSLQDPVGEISQIKLRPNGIQVGQMRVPLGVIGMIYESRPNVTVDAAALSLKTGNAIILRGGSEAIHSNLALLKVLQESLQASGIDKNAIQVIPTTERTAVNILLMQEAFIDLIIPRGGEGLIRFVAENSRIPVLKHYKGVCHIYVDKDADLKKAVPIVINSKTHRPGVCNALEGLLINKDILTDFLPLVIKELLEKNVVSFGCEKCVELDKTIQPAENDTWGKEFLDLALAIKCVDDYDDAKRYIAQHGSNHTEVILTENYSLARKFIKEIDASAVMVNASTRFNDGGELGLGAEIGISTSKLHAYGPMGLKELTTQKFVVYGEGQIRS